MVNVFNYIMIVIYLIVVGVDLYRMLLIVQESHYHFNSLKIILRKAFSSYTYFLLFPIFSVLYEGTDLIIFNCCSVCILGLYIYLRTRKKHILKLNFTMRIKRLCGFISLLNILSIYILIIKDLIMLSPLLMITNVIYLYASLIILNPLETLIQYSYHNKARKKINEVKPLVIGITGSCGKTSCKHYLYQILKDKYITFMTPKSYNTCNGISKSILENMNKFTEIAIIEYGASHVGDIEKSLKIVKPEISLITNISLQHLETFVTEDNIKKEKTLLMKNSKVHFYNKLSNYQLECDKCISFSIEKGGDYYVKDIVYKENKTSFKIVCKCDNGSEQEITIETKLLGKTNVINICACVAICKYLGLDNKYIVNKVKNLKPFPSRLEVIRKDDNIIINDSFNSNKLGFIEALNVLNLFKEYKKIVITPGVVTGGKEISAINEDIAYKIMGVANSCYLVDSISTDYFSKVFDGKLYNYHKYESFTEAYNDVIKIKGKKVILIENDITDIYRR